MQISHKNTKVFINKYLKLVVIHFSLGALEKKIQIFVAL